MKFPWIKKDNKKEIKEDISNSQMNANEEYINTNLQNSNLQNNENKDREDQRKLRLDVKLYNFSSFSDSAKETLNLLVKSDHIKSSLKILLKDL